MDSERKPCWCDGKKAGFMFRSDANRLVEENFCPSCGRDLRLPVARVYRGEVPECIAVDQWWFIGAPSLGRRPFKVELLGDTLFCGSYDLRRMPQTDRRFTIASLVMFGPVTVSPEVPEVPK